VHSSELSLDGLFGSTLVCNPTLVGVSLWSMFRVMTLNKFFASTCLCYQGMLFVITLGSECLVSRPIY